MTFGDYQQCVFLAVLGTSFLSAILHYMFLLYADPFSLSSSHQENSMNKDLLILKQKKTKKIINTHTSNKRAPKYKEQKLIELKEEKEK